MQTRSNVYLFICLFLTTLSAGVWAALPTFCHGFRSGGTMPHFGDSSKKVILLTLSNEDVGLWKAGTYYEVQKGSVSHILQFSDDIPENYLDDGRPLKGVIWDSWGVNGQGTWELNSYAPNSLGFSAELIFTHGDTDYSTEEFAVLCALDNTAR